MLGHLRGSQALQGVVGMIDCRDGSNGDGDGHKASILTQIQTPVE